VLHVVWYKIKKLQCALDFLCIITSLSKIVCNNISNNVYAGSGVFFSKSLLYLAEEEFYILLLQLQPIWLITLAKQNMSSLKIVPKGVSLFFSWYHLTGKKLNVERPLCIIYLNLVAPSLPFVFCCLQCPSPYSISNIRKNINRNKKLKPNRSIRQLVFFSSKLLGSQTCTRLIPEEACSIDIPHALAHYHAGNICINTNCKMRTIYMMAKDRHSSVQTSISLIWALANGWRLCR
jgi:hypothetical protein